MSDYGAKSRAQMMERYRMERRMKKMRRLYYNAVDAMGFFALCCLGVLATACLLFVVYHR